MSGWCGKYEVHGPHEWVGIALRSQCLGVEKLRCPDGGTCHHECLTGCYRVACCSPLGAVYSGNEWPRQVIAEYGNYTVASSPVPETQQ